MLWVNLIMDSLASLSLATEAPDGAAARHAEQLGAGGRGHASHMRQHRLATPASLAFWTAVNGRAQPASCGCLPSPHSQKPLLLAPAVRQTRCWTGRPSLPAPRSYRPPSSPTLPASQRTRWAGAHHAQLGRGGGGGVAGRRGGMHSRMADLPHNDVCDHGEGDVHHVIMWWLCDPCMPDCAGSGAMLVAAPCRPPRWHPKAAPPCYPLF
jgi:hypothetical protein